MTGILYMQGWPPQATSSRQPRVGRWLFGRVGCTPGIAYKCNESYWRIPRLNEWAAEY